MVKLFYQGHGSFRLELNDGRIIYVDPYAGIKESYALPADIILVTHQHHDHNQIDLCAKKEECRIITNIEALAGGRHNIFDIDGVIIEAVEASNKNHNPQECAGYIITADGIRIYAAGDTSKTEQMQDFKDIDYALLPCDGKYNMYIIEAAECAKIIGAKHNIPYHIGGGLSDREKREKAETFNAPNRLIIDAGQEIDL